VPSENNIVKIMSFDILSQDVVSIIFKTLDIRTIYLLANTNNQLFLLAINSIKNLLIDNWYYPLNKKRGSCYVDINNIKKIINIIPNNIDIIYDNYNLIKYRYLIFEDPKIKQIHIKQIEIQDAMNYIYNDGKYLFENIIYRPYNKFTNINQNAELFKNTPIIIKSCCQFNLSKKEFKNDVLNLFIILCSYKILDKYKFENGWKIGLVDNSPFNDYGNYLYLQINKNGNLIAQLCYKTNYKSDITYITHKWDVVSLLKLLH